MKGLVVKPSGGVLNINAFPDADFAGMYGQEDPADPACVKSRTGFVDECKSVLLLVVRIMLRLEECALGTGQRWEWLQSEDWVGINQQVHNYPRESS